MWNNDARNPANQLRPERAKCSQIDEKRYIVSFKGADYLLTHKGGNVWIISGRLLKQKIFVEYGKEDAIDWIERCC